MIKHSYGTAIRSAFEYLLENYPECFIIGQGLWSPWYVGNTMTDLDKKYGEHRIIDTPVSEAAVTASLNEEYGFASEPKVAPASLTVAPT